MWLFQPEPYHNCDKWKTLGNQRFHDATFVPLKLIWEQIQANLLDDDGQWMMENTIITIESSGSQQPHRKIKLFMLSNDLGMNQPSHHQHMHLVDLNPSYFCTKSRANQARAIKHTKLIDTRTWLWQCMIYFLPYWVLSILYIIIIFLVLVVLHSKLTFFNVTLIGLNEYNPLKTLQWVCSCWLYAGDRLGCNSILRDFCVLHGTKTTGRKFRNITLVKDLNFLFC